MSFWRQGSTCRSYDPGDPSIRAHVLGPETTFERFAALAPITE